MKVERLSGIITAQRRISVRKARGNGHWLLRFEGLQVKVSQQNARKLREELDKVL